MIRIACYLGLISILLQCYHNYLFRGLPFQKSSEFEKYFSSDYYDARNRFRKIVQQHPSNMELHSLALVVEDEEDSNGGDYTIDIGVLRRSNTKLLIHVSGTHGVEGFAGNAIQCALLEDMIGTAHNDENDDALPTLLFVHALNPFGFAKSRRFNENNVDLNRNFLSTEQFEKVRAKDPNHSGYMDAMEFLNPTESFETKWDFFYIGAIYHILSKGYYNIKQAIVSGNYHFPETIFFGGTEMQQSLLLLQDFLVAKFDMQSMKTIGIMDIHTGLGPSGYDSIGIHGAMGLEEAKQLFGGPNNELDDRISFHGNASSNKALKGYDDVTGMIQDGLMECFSPLDAKVISLIQEFGTVPGILVLKAMRAENNMYHHDPTHRSPKYTQDLRDVFYLKDNPKWKTNIVLRGKAVFYQLQSKLSKM